MPKAFALAPEKPLTGVATTFRLRETLRTVGPVAQTEGAGPISSKAPVYPGIEPVESQRRGALPRHTSEVPLDRSDADAKPLRRSRPIPALQGKCRFDDSLDDAVERLA